MSTTVDSNTSAHLGNDAQQTSFGQLEQCQVGPTGNLNAMVGSSSRKSVACDTAALTPSGSIETDLINGISRRESKKKNKKKTKNKGGNDVQEVRPFAINNQSDRPDRVVQTKLKLNPNMQQSNINNNDLSTGINQNQLVNQTSLSSPSTQIYLHESHAIEYNPSSDMVTVKKGVLWQQQDHDKFHQRLFSRWKKRFFILTTDYLVCFKRSTSKVGRSEMGRFLYKTSLGDILNIEWLRPKKSDKGAIILRMKNQFNLFLWSKNNLDEWMTLINATRVKRKLRNGLADDGDFCLSQPEVIEPSSQNGIYENAPLPAGRNQLVCDQKTCNDGEVHRIAPAQFIEDSISERTTSVVRPMGRIASFEHFKHGLIERGNQNGNQQQTDTTDANIVTVSSDESRPAGDDQAQAPARPSPNMINDVGDAPADVSKPLRRMEQNLSSDDLSTMGPTSASEAAAAKEGQHSPDQLGRDAGALSMMSRSSSIRQERRPTDGAMEDCEATSVGSNQAICRDSNDNLVLMSDKLKSELSGRKEKISNDKRKGTASKEPSDKHHTDTANGSGLDKHLPELHKLMPTEQEDSEEQPVDETEVQPSGQLRPTTNFIRRDESWHSLLTLNQIGNNKQVERSLYAQRIVSANESSQIVSNIDTEHFRREDQRNSNLKGFNIESTVTPLRGKPFARQQSMQLHNERRLPTIGQSQHSFDVGQTGSSQVRNNNNQQPLTSYHQKLLQLQLMHSRNHADYLRNNNGDQQVYGPGSIATTTNHYGYYSMRSNFRSATSEFSFIRPSSSDFDAPHQPPPPVPVQSSFEIPNGSRGLAQPYNSNGSSPFAFANTPYAPPYAPIDNGRNNAALLGAAARIGQNPMQDPIRVAEQFKSQLAWNALVAPTRELPLKPNKKRQQSGSGSQKSSSSTTFGSSIVHFFRRAFSKRSKRRPQMAESCSSSLGGAYNDMFGSMQRARSAFSTSDGQRSTRGELIDQHQQSAINQRHRMIDLIEAFANKTAIDPETYNNLSQAQNRTDLAANYLTSMRASIQNNISIPSKLAQHQLQPMTNSPLHKSNSISTSTGLSGFNELMHPNDRYMFANGPMSPVPNPRHSGPMSSPLITRSTKVMSVHLTPVSSRKEAFDQHEPGYLNSPRRSMNFDHQPRPSSIYGQPSLISSPMNVREQRGNDFGSHRSSIHSYHLRPERIQLNNSNIDMRRHHHSAMKAPYLDTTREVAEEVSSPTAEAKSFINQELQNSGQQMAPEDCIGPMNQKNRIIAQQRRSRIVSPMLQSPTMSLIYDNHPTPLDGNSVAYSHYDNHGLIEHQQSLSSMDLSAHSFSHHSSEAANELEARGHRRNNLDLDISSPIAACRNPKMRQSYNASALVTPSHRGMRLAQQQQQQSQHASPDGPHIMDMARGADGYIKPSSIISPLTPTGHRAREPDHVLRSPNSSNLINPALSGQFNPYSRAGARPDPVARPPIKLPQQQQHTQYQQSPLVSKQTRILKRGDGVQATLFGPEMLTSGDHQSMAVVNTSGSYGANPELPIDEVILRVKDTKSSESPASSLHSNLNRNSSGTKTFLVSPRVSSNSSSIDGNQARPENGLNEREEIRNDGSSSRSTSSGTDPISTSSSSRSDTSAKRKITTEAKARHVRKDKSKRNSNEQTSQRDQHNGSSDDRRRRGSSTDHSDELSSQADSLNEPKAESKKWVTSKLMQ